MLSTNSTVLRRLINWAAAATVITLLVWPRAVLAATNTAVDAGGGSVSLVSSGPVTVNSVKLGLVKQARDLTGTVLPNGGGVASGQVIYFVLFVDNPTGVPANNVTIIDQLDQSQFTYVANSLEITSVASGASNAVIWAGAWSALTDTVGAPDDAASITDSVPPPGPDRITVGAVAGQVNQTVNIPGNTIRAIRFRVTVN